MDKITLAAWAEKYGTVPTDLQQEQGAAKASSCSPRERIVKVWSTPTEKEASDLLHRFNPAGNNQIEKAYMQGHCLKKQ